MQAAMAAPSDRFDSPPSSRALVATTCSCAQSASLLQITEEDRLIVASLQRRGFALARLSRREASIIQRAHRDALRFFSQPEGIKKECRRHVRVPAVGPEPILIGHSKPSSSKELLRQFSAMPPKLNPSLRRSAAQARRILHELLCRIMLAVASGHVTRRSLRQLTRGACPLDFFYYYNQASVTVPCTPHVDRGYLHAIVASPVPGLELYEREQPGHQATWRAPSDLWPELEPMVHVVVLANDALARLSNSSTGWRSGRIEACVHRVVRAENVPRLSISYELRPSSQAKETDLLDNLDARLSTD